MNVVEEIEEILCTVGASRYGSEKISQLQHALQCATHAESDGASAALITAALLHDIGHLIGSQYEGMAEKGIDRRHEVIGRVFLSKWFGEDVTAPVALHVPAKRYLCAVDSDYAYALSPASQRSLELQGGAFDGNDARRFIESPRAKDAVRLRRWDEDSKNPDAMTPGLNHFLCYVKVALQSAPAQQA